MPANPKTDKLIGKFFKTNSGIRMMEKYSLDDEGVWLVRGEDPNCDMGGQHHQPLLGHFQGKLSDVIRIAVTLDRFWTWGGGGSIERIDILSTDDITTLPYYKTADEMSRAMLQESVSLIKNQESLRRWIMVWMRDNFDE